MMGSKAVEPKLFLSFDLDAAVPPTHILRRIAEVVDFSFVRDLARPCYSHTGQPSVDPVVLFKLSLLGYEPADDHEAIAREARGRRLFPAAPEQSLLLLKATGTIPHGGGRVLAAGSEDYEVLHRWIAQGGPPPRPDDPVVEQVAIEPKEVKNLTSMTSFSKRLFVNQLLANLKIRYPVSVRHGT